MASVSIVYRKDKINKDKESPIHFRIIKDRKVSYISSGIKCTENLWDEKNHRLKSKHTNSARHNSFLSNRFTELQDEVFGYETTQKTLTSRQLKDKINGKKPTHFFTFADEANEVYLSDGKVGTFDKNRSIIAKLKEYMKNTTLTFQDITPEFLLRYERHLKAKHNNSINTIHRDMKFIRKLFNDAVRVDLIEISQSPFSKYKLKLEKTQRTYLTEDELLKIEKLEITPGTRMELHKDMFIFASYAGGLRVSDILLLKWKHFDGAKINLTIMKTGTQLSIRVPNKALEIIKKYEPRKISSNHFIFPILPNELDLKDLREVDTALSRGTAYINKNLKVIAAKAEIEKNISFHISRHTWATRALSKGISIDKVSKLMGHAAIKETQIYAKIISSELDKAMEVFNE